MDFEKTTQVNEHNHSKPNESASTSEDLNVSKETVKLSRVGRRASAGKGSGKAIGDNDNVKSETEDVKEPLKNGKVSKNVSSADRDKRRKEKEKLWKEEKEQAERILIIENSGFITDENIFKLFSTGKKLKDVRKMSDSEARDILLQSLDVQLTLNYIKSRDARQKVYLEVTSNLRTFLKKVGERSQELCIKFDSFIGGNNLNDVDDIKSKIQWFTEEIMGDWTDHINLISLAQIYISKFLKEKIKNVSNTNCSKTFDNSNLKCNESINFIAKVMLTSSKDIQSEINSVKLRALGNPDPILVAEKKKIINSIYFQIILRLELADYLSYYNPNVCDIKIHNRKDLSLDILVHDTNELFDILITEGVEEKTKHFLENVICNAYLESAILPKIYEVQGFPKPQFLRDVSIPKKPKRPSDEKMKRLKSNDSLVSTSSTTTTTNSSQILENKLTFPSNIHKKASLSNSNLLQRQSSIPTRKPPVTTSIFHKNERKILVAQPRHLLQTSSSSYSDKSSPSIMYRSVSNSKFPSPKKVCRNLFNSEPPKDMSGLLKMKSSPLKKFPILKYNTNIISPVRTYQHQHAYKLHSHSHLSPVGLKDSSANVFKSPESIALYRYKSKTPVSSAKKSPSPSPLKNSATFSFEQPKRIVNCKRKLELDSSTTSEIEVEANRDFCPSTSNSEKINKIVDLSPDITDFRSSTSKARSNKKSIPIPIMKNSQAQREITFSPLSNGNDYYQHREICPETPKSFLKSPQILGSIEEICESPPIKEFDTTKQNHLLKKGISAASFYSGHSDDSKTWENSYAKVKSDEVHEIMFEKYTLSTSS